MHLPTLGTLRHNTLASYLTMSHTLFAENEVKTPAVSETGRTLTHIERLYRDWADVTPRGVTDVDHVFIDRGLVLEFYVGEDGTRSITVLKTALGADNKAPVLFETEVDDWTVISEPAADVIFPQLYDVLEAHATPVDVE